MILQNDKEDVSPFLSIFLYCPAILFICQCACMCVVPTYSTVGRYAPSTPDLGLNAEAKKKKNITKRRRNIFQQCNAVCFVWM